MDKGQWTIVFTFPSKTNLAQVYDFVGKTCASDVITFPHCPFSIVHYPLSSNPNSHQRHIISLYSLVRVLFDECFQGIFLLLDRRGGILG